MNIFLDHFFGQKCVFYACFTLIGSWEGGKNFSVGIFLNENLLGTGLQETNNFFFRPDQYQLCIFRDQTQCGSGTIAGLCN